MASLRSARAEPPATCHGRAGSGQGGAVEADEQAPDTARDLGGGGLDEAVQPVGEHPGEGGGHGRGDQVGLRRAGQGPFGPAPLAQVPVEGVAERSAAAGAEQFPVEPGVPGEAVEEVEQGGRRARRVGDAAPGVQGVDRLADDVGAGVDGERLQVGVVEVERGPADAGPARDGGDADLVQRAVRALLQEGLAQPVGVRSVRGSSGTPVTRPAGRRRAPGRRAGPGRSGCAGWR